MSAYRRPRRGSTRRDRPAWSPAEDAALAVALQVGLASEFWSIPLPGRAFGDICDRRLALGIRPAPLI